MIETRTIGRPFNAKLEIYSGCKYTAHSMADLGEIITTEYKGIINWEIISGEDAAELEKETDGTEIDEVHEYLRLNFEDGATSIFRNSHVDMFRI